MSLFGGKKPKRVGPSADERQLGEDAAGLRSVAARYHGVVEAGNRELAAGRVGERNDFLGSASADAAIAQGAQGPVTSTSAALPRALTRGRGLSRLIGAKSDMFDAQLLRDRAAAVGQGRARQAMGLAGMAQVAGMRKQIDDAQRMKKQVADESRANVLGSVAGIGLGMYANRGTLFPKNIKGDPAGASYQPTTGTMFA
jgi:hypothetical protein